MLPDNIVIQSDPERLLGSFLSARKYTQVGMLMDDHTQGQCYPLLGADLPYHKILIPSGEEHKNLDTCIAVWQKLTELAFDRHSLLVILGGGVLGDLGGFCAATFKRGIDFVLMPTTLLAQADASVGGKLGIDFQHHKNHIGLFKEPLCTLIATGFLKTLPERELRSGFAEVIKHCILSDKAMWNTVSSMSLNTQPWGELIRHSVAFKYSVIQRDPRENGLRKILNFGHTLGHALESWFLAKGNRIFHGEAIAAGMMAEAFIAKKKELLAYDELEQICSYIIDVFGKITLPNYSELMPFVLQDKKNRGDKILMALPSGIGKAVWDIVVSEEEIKESLGFYASR